MQPLVHTVTYSQAPAGHVVPPTNVPHVAHNITAPLSAAASETSYVRVAPDCVHGAAVRLDPLNDAQVTGIARTTDGGIAGLAVLVKPGHTVTLRTWLPHRGQATREGTLLLPPDEPTPGSQAPNTTGN